MGSMYRFGAILTLAGLFGACSDSGNTARVDLLLTDAAGDVAAVWVDLAEVYLQGTGGRTDLLGGSTGPRRGHLASGDRAGACPRRGAHAGVVRASSGT